MKSAIASGLCRTATCKNRVLVAREALCLVEHGLPGRNKCRQPAPSGLIEVILNGDTRGSIGDEVFRGKKSRLPQCSRAVDDTREKPRFSLLAYMQFAQQSQACGDIQQEIAAVRLALL